MVRIEPILEISEKLSPDIFDVKIGQRVDAIVNYRVIEQTKSYTVLRITGCYLINNKRMF